MSSIYRCGKLYIFLNFASSALEISEAKHADLITRMTAQLRDLNTVKQDAHRETSDLKKKLQVSTVEGRGQRKSHELHIDDWYRVSVDTM